MSWYEEDGYNGNINHPEEGSSTRVEPIRDREKIERIKKLLKKKPRDLCIFVLGINTAFRCGDLLNLTRGSVKDLKVGDYLRVNESKTGNLRITVINGATYNVIQNHLENSEGEDEDRLFTGQRGPLTVGTVTNNVKLWCRSVGLRDENYGSHTLRKTWGYWQRIGRGTPIILLTKALGHSTQGHTCDYLGIIPEEIEELYEYEL